MDNCISLLMLSLDLARNGHFHGHVSTAHTGPCIISEN